MRAYIDLVSKSLQESVGQLKSGDAIDYSLED